MAGWPGFLTLDAKRKITAPEKFIAPLPGPYSFLRLTSGIFSNSSRLSLAKTDYAGERTNAHQVAPAGVVRILELQEQGYQYLRP